MGWQQKFFLEVFGDRSTEGNNVFGATVQIVTPHHYSNLEIIKLRVGNALDNYHF